MGELSVSGYWGGGVVCGGFLRQRGSVGEVCTLGKC